MSIKRGLTGRKQVRTNADSRGKGEGYVRVGDQEYQVEAESSVVVPPGTRHCFGLHGPGIIKAFAVLGHRVFKEGSEPPDLPPPNR